MKLKVLLIALGAFTVLHFANRYLNGGNAGRGSLETTESNDDDEREKFMVGFLPVT